MARNIAGLQLPAPVQTRFEADAIHDLRDANKNRNSPFWVGDP